MDDTEVKTGEHSITANFLPEMVDNVRNSAKENTSSLSSIQYHKDSRNYKYSSNVLTNSSSTKRKLRASKGMAFN